jgi:hypothetical protein
VLLFSLCRRIFVALSFIFIVIGHRSFFFFLVSFEALHFSCSAWRFSLRSVSSSNHHGAFPHHATDFSLSLFFLSLSVLDNNLLDKARKGGRAQKGATKDHLLFCFLFFVFFGKSHDATRLSLYSSCKKIHARHITLLQSLEFPFLQTFILSSLSVLNHNSTMNVDGKRTRCGMERLTHKDNVGLADGMIGVRDGEESDEKWALKSLLAWFSSSILTTVYMHVYGSSLGISSFVGPQDGEIIFRFIMIVYIRFARVIPSVISPLLSSTSSVALSQGPNEIDRYV